MSEENLEELLSSFYYAGISDEFPSVPHFEDEEEWQQAGEWEEEEEEWEEGDGELTSSPPFYEEGSYF